MGFIVMLAVLAAVVWVVVTVARSAAGKRDEPESRSATHDDPALAVLRERYARGEIDRDTYERMRRDLKT